MDESKPSSQQATDVINHITNQIMIAPVRLGSKIAKTIQPYTTQLLAISIVLFLVPILITLSLYAGFFVWKSVAVSWKIPLYLQYGYVGHRNCLKTLKESLLPGTVFRHGRRLNSQDWFRGRDMTFL